MGTTRMETGPVGAPARYTYVPAPGVPPVTVFRFDRVDVVATAGVHAHSFPALAFFVDAGGTLVSAGRRWPILAGDLFVVPPGSVMGADRVEEIQVEGAWGLAFTPDALGPRIPTSFLAWRNHPLLSLFVHGDAKTPLRLNVPADARGTWVGRLEALEDEQLRRRPGYQEAVIGHLMVLLVEVTRLAADVSVDLRLNDEPMLADVFEVIERRFHEPLSLRDVALALGLTPGYVTTVVRRRTGRTVLEWIAERRMTEARRLLVETDHSVQEVGRRVGYRDPGYFARSFRRTHGVTPLAWRRTGRTSAG